MFVLVTSLLFSAPFISVRRNVIHCPNCCQYALRVLHFLNVLSHYVSSKSMNIFIYYGMFKMYQSEVILPLCAIFFKGVGDHGSPLFPDFCSSK